MCERADLLRNKTLITCQFFNPNLTGFQNLSGLIFDLIKFLFLIIIMPINNWLIGVRASVGGRSFAATHHFSDQRFV